MSKWRRSPVDTTHHGWADARFIGGNMNLPNGKGDKLHLNTLMMIMQRDRCGNWAFESLHTLFTSVILSHHILLTNISQMHNQNVVWVYILDISRSVHLIDRNIFPWQIHTKVIFMSSYKDWIGKHSLVFLSAAPLLLKNSYYKNQGKHSSEIWILGKEFCFLVPCGATHTFAKRVPFKGL